MAAWSRYLDPKTEPGVKVVGDKVLDTPKLKEFQTVDLQVHRLRTDEHTGKVTIRHADIIG